MEEQITIIKPITQASIDNVGLTHIITGKNSLSRNEYIRSLCRKVLEISMNRKDGNRYNEVGILARIDGSYETKPIYGYWNKKHTTCLIDTQYNVEYNYLLDESSNNSLIFVHNHPNNSSVSFNDIMNLFSGIQLQIAAVVAVSNNGNVSYVKRDSLAYKFYLTTGEKIYKGMQNKSTNDRTIHINKLYKDMMDNPSKYKLSIVKAV